MPQSRNMPNPNPAQARLLAALTSPAASHTSAAVPRRILLAVAAPAEVRAIFAGIAHTDEPGPITGDWSLRTLNERLDLVQTGIGKANAAGAVARVLDPTRHAAVISLGVAGSLPTPTHTPPAIGDIIIADACINADEGLRTPDEFVDCARMGFPLCPTTPGGMGAAIAASPALVQMLKPLVSVTPAGVTHLASVATVSTCSGTDAQAREIATRTGAAAEAMEGAAIAQVAHRLAVPFAEIRVISNTTGDRARQVWDLPKALRVLTSIAARL